MPDPQSTPDRDAVSDAVLASIRTTCHRLAATHGLSEPVERELCGHMEEKLHAYLSGAEKLSDVDALLLVEKHFGDPHVLGRMLGQVHARPTVAVMLRRLAAAATATVAAMLAVHAVGLLVPVLTGNLFRGINSFSSWGRGPVQLVPIELIHPVYGVLSLGLAALLLLRWRRSSSHGRSPWYQRWPAAAVVAIPIIIAGAFGAAQFFSVPERSSVEPRAVDNATALVLLLAHGWLWLWWLDRSAGAVPKILTGTFGYSLFLAAWLIAAPVSLRGIAKRIPHGDGYQYVYEWRRFWILSIQSPDALGAYLLSSATMLCASLFLLYYAWARWGRRTFASWDGCSPAASAIDRL